MAPRLLLWLLAAGLCLGEGKPKKSNEAEKESGGWSEKTNEEGKVVQQLKIEAPSMTEEDQYGYKMPDRYKCDSCRAVMFHLDVALKKVHPKSRRMKQWEYTDTFDDACRSSFEGYGIKLLNGQNTLSGPGLVHEDTIEPGMGAIQMGGETWGKRLSEACRTYVYERVGEDELYDKYREDGGLSEAICYQDLRDCVKAPHGPQTAPVPIEEPKAPKKAKKEKEKKKEKKEKVKESKDAGPKAAAAAGKAAAATGGKEERVDSATFFRHLAERHGLTSDEYLTARTERDWEKLVVAMAGRIFNKHAGRNEL